MDEPVPLQVRENNGQWEVQTEPDRWVLCSCKDDASQIAALPFMQYEAMSLMRSTDIDFADECEKLSNVLKQHRMRFHAYFFACRAQEIREAYSEANG